MTSNGTRVWRRYRLVVACRDKLRLPPEVLAALESRTRDHVLTTSGFFPCSIDREYLYGYAADGHRSPLWLCAFFFRPTPPRLSPGRYTSFYLPEIELTCMKSHKRELVWTFT